MQQNPKPFAVYGMAPGQSPKPLFVVHAYTLEAARQIAAAKVAGEVVVLPALWDDGAHR